MTCMPKRSLLMEQAGSESGSNLSLTTRTCGSLPIHKGHASGMITQICGQRTTTLSLACWLKALILGARTIMSRWIEEFSCGVTEPAGLRSTASTTLSRFGFLRIRFSRQTLTGGTEYGAGQRHGVMRREAAAFWGAEAARTRP